MTARGFSIALTVLVASVSFAETDLTPERAVALALEKNAGVAAASARVAAAEGLRTQAGLKPNPRFISSIRECTNFRSPSVPVLAGYG